LPISLVLSPPHKLEGSLFNNTLKFVSQTLFIPYFTTIICLCCCPRITMPKRRWKNKLFTKVSLWQHGFLALFMICSTAFPAFNQCAIIGPTPIPDNDSITLGFNVSGLTNASLASPLQGICGVDVSFNHEYLGDLTITLISPAGTSVQLVGPPSLLAPQTNLSTWNVHFIPCGSPANPDAGFADQWSNDQMWDILTTYSGIYHPAAGCLEDFNVGSANGQWIIIVKDHDLLQTGNLISITLIFCDPTGLNCSECIPNAGVLSPASFDRCAGQSIQSADITVDFANNTPSPFLYGYQYLLVQGSTILQSGSAFSAIPPAGSYTLCGLSYLLADSVNVNADLAAGDLAGLLQDIMSGAICGKVSDVCIPVEIAAPPDTVVITTTLCQGEVFSFGGQNYTSNGTFYQVHDGPGMCDSIFEIRIAPRSLNVIIPVPDTLFCNLPMISLSAITGGANGPFSFFWTTSFGNITSSNTLPSITVDQAGPYTVSVTDGICGGAANTNVYAGPGFPQIFVDGGTITCSQTSVNLVPVYIPSNGSVMWTGPMGFMSTQPNINASLPGNYVLTITNTQGCSTSKEVLVGLDTTTFPISIYELPRYCPSGEVGLSVATGIPIVNYSWTGPNNFMANAGNPSVSDAGLYFVTSTFANGCQVTASHIFDGDFALPNISVPMTDTLNCSEIISLTVTSNTPGATYYWQLPNGSFAVQATLMVQQEGVYTAIVTGPNGCQNTAPVEIVEGADVFPFELFFDTLDCNHPIVTIGVTSMQADEFQWLNYAGPDADQSSIEVNSAGNYDVILTDTNSHCVLTASIFVPSDFGQPDFGYVLDTITCLDPMAQLSFIPYGGFMYTNVFWELPDLSIIPGPVLSTGLPGVYHLHAEAPNGCVNVKSIVIPVDTLPPFLLIEGDSITCDDTARIAVHPVDSVIAYAWTGPAILNDLGNVIEVTEAGIYTLEATGINGCINTVDIIVDSNYVLPIYTLVADTLRCDRPATLSVVTSESLLQYQWYDPSGLAIGTDSTIDVVLPGTYTIEIHGVNRCFAYDTFVLTAVTYPQISITTDTFTCADKIATLQSHIDIQPTSIIWQDVNNTTIGQNANVMVTQEGPFYLVVTGPNGCESRDTVTVPYDSITPHAIISLIGEVRCQQKNVMFDGSGSTGANLSFEWSTMGGNIVSDPLLPVINALDTGWYQLIVIGNGNGCPDTASYHLLPSPDEITQVMFSIMQARCSGDINGSIALTGITGGIEPFLFQLNGGPPQTDSLFDHLIPGMYQFAILDDAGCSYDTLISLPPTNVFTVDAGPDVEVYIGGTTTLTGMTDLVAADISGLVWDSLGVGLCTNCPDFEVSPYETTVFTFQVTSNTGCVVEDQLTVFVLEKGKFYIPNVFSPNGDNINDEVRIYPSPGIQKVIQWVIFDRWGNAVYGKTDFDPNDPTVFWDGRTSTGEFANPAVFPYMLEIQLINGKIELVHGNITLIR